MSGNIFSGGVFGGGGASAFIDLTDVPSSYLGQSGKSVTVNGTADGLIFSAGASSSKLGSWDVVEIYSPNDMTTHLGIVYKCILASTGNIPASSPTYWSIYLSDFGTAQGQMLFWDVTAGKWTYAETSELFWDDTNKRLGIGTATPGSLLDVNGDVYIAGNLVVVGSSSIIESETVLIGDNYLSLNTGYATAVAQAGGLVVNYLPTSTNDTVGTGGFTAGVPATSNPTVITVGSATFAASDLIQISDADNPLNDGIYEVLSHVGTTLTIRGIGVTGTVEGFTKNQFIADATVAGTICKVTVSIIRTGADGIWETGKGSATGITFTDVLTSIPLTSGTTAGQMAFWSGSVWTYTETSELFWDDTNKRIGIGTSSPSYPLDVRATSTAQGSVQGVLQLLESDIAYSAGPKAGILFSGLYNSSSGTAVFSAIQGQKENATDGDYAGALTLHTRINGGNLTEKVRVTGSGCVGIGVTPVDDEYMFGIRRNFPSITSGGTNNYNVMKVDKYDLPISSGVTDNGSRVCLIANGYVDSTSFEGTLATQIGIWCRVGSFTAAPTGTITNQYSLFIDNVTGENVTVTNKYGIYQNSDTAQNYFAGKTIIGSGNIPRTVLHVDNGPTNSPGTLHEVLRIQSDGALNEGGIIAFSNTRAANVIKAMMGYRGVAGYGAGGDIFFGINSVEDTSHVSFSDVKMIVKASGNVGIGTTGPLSALHILTAGTAIAPPSSTALTLQGSVSAGSSVFLDMISGNTGDVGVSFGDTDDNDIGGIYYRHATDQMEFYTNATAKMYILSSGYVGIGTASPGSALQVNGTVTATAFASGSPFILKVGSTEYMRISDAGFIGIGTNDPGSLLDVYKENATTGARIRIRTKDTSAGSPPFSYLEFRGSTTGDASADFAAGEIRAGFDGSGYTNSRVTLSSATAANTYTDALHIKNGNVGIGAATITPTHQLHVENPSGDAEAAIVSATSGTSILCLGDVGDHNVCRIFYSNPANTLVISTDSTVRMRIDSAGKVGINSSLDDAFNGGLSLLDTGGSDYLSWMTMYRHSADAQSAGIWMGKSRGSKASKAIVANGDTIGAINFNAYDGSSFLNTASIGVVINGTVGVNDMPTDMTFSTCPDGSNASVERVRINSAGKVGIGTPLNDSYTGGITLSTDSASDNKACLANYAYSTGNASIQMFKARGTKASPTIVQSGDWIGSWVGNSYDGNTWNNSAGIAFVSESTPADQDTPAAIVFYTANDNEWGMTERMRLGRTGKLGINTPLDDAWNTGLTLLDTGSSDYMSWIAQYKHSADGECPGLTSGKSRGSKASKAIVQNGDQLYAFQISGYDGANFITAASIRVYVTGTPGTNDMPASLLFYTCPDGSATVTERMRITHQANFGFNTTDQFGSGAGVFGIANATTNPTTNPTSGGVLYAEGGAGKWRSSGGTVTTFGTAEPHCPVCNNDFMHEWENESKGKYLAVCMNCLADELGSRPYILRQKAA